MIRFSTLPVLDKASLILAAALLCCLLPMPYGFYIIIRLAVAVLSCCWAYRFYKSGKMPATVICIAVAILFQPLVKIYLDRLTWNIVDIVLAVVIFVLVSRRGR